MSDWKIFPQMESRASFAGRRIFLKSCGVGMMWPLTACRQEGTEKMRNEIFLTLVMYSYLDRIIYDIDFNGTGLGLANRYGGTGIITDVRIPFGSQELQWTLGGPKGMSRNGELVRIKNDLTILPAQIPSETNYIGLHLYPDYTAEVTFDESIPDRTPRGQKIIAERK